jgi:hypothetical protein
MPTPLLSDKYRDQLDGVLNCYDRIILFGSLQPWCYAQGMTHYLYTHQIRICPVITKLNLSYHWSIFQAEYATDLVFKRHCNLQAFYPHLVETMIHSVKPDDIVTFLGHKLYGHYQGEMGTRFNVRWLAVCRRETQSLSSVVELTHAQRIQNS